MKKVVLLAAATAVIASAGALAIGHAPQARAADPAPATHQCIDTQYLDTKMIVDKDKLLLQDSSGHATLVTLAPPCSQMQELDHVGFVYDGDTRLCHIHDIKILYSRTDEPSVQCLITDIKPLTKAEAKAYSSQSSSAAH